MAKFHYTIKINHSKKTYTIKRYDNNKLTSVYRSNPQSELIEDWTQDDIMNFLRKSNDYYVVK